MSNFFKSGGGEKVDPEVKVVADPYAQTRNSLQNWLTGQIGNNQSYQGQMVAPLTSQEQQSKAYLDKYASTPMPAVWQKGVESLTSTLNGDYDPSKSSYYQAVKAEASRNLADAQKSIASNAGGGGRYYTGARLKEQGNAATDTAIGLNKTLGELSEAERQRMFSAIPLAQQAGQYEQQLPLQQAAALQTYGGQDRQISQAMNEAAYQEWVNSMRNYPLQVAGVASGVQQAPMYGQVGYTPTTPSPFSQIAAPILSGVASGVGSGFGAASGASIFSKLFGSGK